MNHILHNAFAWRFGATLLFLSITFAAHSQPRRERIVLEGDPVEMSLAQVVEMAFEQNLDIEIERIDSRIATHQLLGEFGIYDPLLEALIGQSQQTDPTVDLNGTSSTRERSTVGNVALSQLIPTGAVISLEAGQSRRSIRDERRNRSSLSPTFEQEAVLAIRQPILKNFGPTVTESGIRIAKRAERIAQLSYQQEILDRLADVMVAYWDLVFAIRNLEVQQASYDAAGELERVNSARLEAGTAPRTDLLQARAQAAERRTLVIQAKSTIIDEQDRLLQLLNWEDPEYDWGAPIVPLDTPDSYNLDLEFNDREILRTALDTRPDYRATALSREIARIDRDVASWQRLPELNLIAEWGASSAETSSSNAFGDLSDGRYSSYFFGAEFRYPIFNRRARAAFRAATEGLERADRLIEQSELEVVTEVRAATRAIRTSQESIEAATAQVEAASETLEAERRRLDVGSSTTFNVLDFQEDLARAQVNQVQALVDYQKGLIELERSRGLLLNAIANQLGVEIKFDDQGE